MHIRFLFSDALAEYRAFTEDDIYTERTRQRLHGQLSILKAMLAQAEIENKKDESDTHKNTLMVVMCGEDFFQGSEISTSSEMDNYKAKCMDMDVAFKLMAEEMTKLSKQYPHILIIPGSFYYAVDAPAEDKAIYLQNKQTIEKSSIYFANAAPVFFGGEWIRLIKKGNFLERITAKKRIPIKTENDFQEATKAASSTPKKQPGKKIDVPYYREDTMTDNNEQSVFMGETPLPLEHKKLAEYKKTSPEFLSPVFEVKLASSPKIIFGLEICGDHTNEKLGSYIKEQRTPLDFHLIPSLGIALKYDATHGKGYRVQCDTSDNKKTSRLTTISREVEKKNIFEPLKPLKFKDEKNKEYTILVSDNLPILRLQKSLTQDQEQHKKFTFFGGGVIPIVDKKKERSGIDNRV